MSGFNEYERYDALGLAERSALPLELMPAARFMLGLLAPFLGAALAVAVLVAAVPSTKKTKSIANARHPPKANSIAPITTPPATPEAPTERAA